MTPKLHHGLLVVRVHRYLPSRSLGGQPRPPSINLESDFVRYVAISVTPLTPIYRERTISAAAAAAAPRPGLSLKSSSRSADRQAANRRQVQEGVDRSEAVIPVTRLRELNSTPPTYGTHRQDVSDVA